MISLKYHHEYSKKLSEVQGYTAAHNPRERVMQECIDWRFPIFCVCWQQALAFMKSFRYINNDIHNNI